MKTIDLFCGAGGFTLGAEAAGAEVVLGVDKWLPAVETSRRAGHRVVCADVGDVQGWLGNVGADVDLVIGGPPCQPFSSAGLKKGRHDERDGYPAALRVLDAVRPTWAAFENVKGFLGSKHTRYRKELLAMFSKRYSWVGVWLLNAANYGVPQYRRRVFIVCGPRPVAPPAPTHGPPNRVQNLFATLQPWRSMHEALGIPCAHLFTTGRHEDGRPIKNVKPGAASPTITAHIGQSHPWQCAGIPWIAETVGHEDAGQAAKGNMRIPAGSRRLTVTEAAKLQDFPADYPWPTAMSNAYRCIGNAVPPGLGRAVVGAIIREASRSPDSPAGRG